MYINYLEFFYLAIKKLEEEQKRWRDIRNSRAFYHEITLLHDKKYCDIKIPPSVLFLHLRECITTDGESLSKRLLEYYLLKITLSPIREIIDSAEEGARANTSSSYCTGP